MWLWLLHGNQGLVGRYRVFRITCDDVLKRG